MNQHWHETILMWNIAQGNQYQLLLFWMCWPSIQDRKKERRSPSSKKETISPRFVSVNVRSNKAWITCCWFESCFYRVQYCFMLSIVCVCVCKCNNEINPSLLCFSFEQVVYFTSGLHLSNFVCVCYGYFYCYFH